MEYRKNRIIVCSPGNEYFHVPDPGKHNITGRADPERAVSQHLLLRHMLARPGIEVINIPEMKDHPNSVFTRDPAVVIREGYIRLRMGLESRRGEEEWMALQLESLGIKKAGSISEPGTAEGGDILIIGNTVFIGHSKRTNAEGVNQLSAIFNTLGMEVRTLNIPDPYLHLGGAMSVLSPEDILCCKGVFPETFHEGFKRIEVPMESFVSGNVISLGNHEVIAERSNIAAGNALIKNGYKIHYLDLSEFIKGTGGPTCLILPA